MQIKAEALGYWYLRLNGFLTIPNFVVHPDSGPGIETDIDVLGVRFPNRAENLIAPMQDDTWFVETTGKPLIVIAEIKKSHCDLNSAWLNQERRNILRMLMALGAFPESEAKAAANAVYEVGWYSNENYYLTLMCLGETVSNHLTRKMPQIPQIEWANVLQFIFKRFSEYEQQKACHKQWDGPGKQLWRTYERVTLEGQGVDEYIRQVEIIQ